MYIYYHPFDCDRPSRFSGVNNNEKMYLQYFVQALSKELFQFTYRWLVTSPQLQKSNLSFLNNGPVLVDSDLVLAERIGNRYKMVESKFHLGLEDGF